MYTGFWWESLRERDRLEDIGGGRRIILKWVLEKSVGKAWNGLVGSRIRRSGALVWMR